MEGTDLFVKILVLSRLCLEGRRKEEEEEFQSLEMRAQAHCKNIGAMLFRSCKNKIHTEI